MMSKNCSWMVVLFVLISVATALENYMDYGNDSTANDKSLRELYRILVQRSVDDVDDFRGLAEHLQPRAAERSPSLRLRFGRSYSKYPVELFPLRALESLKRSPSLRLRFGRSYSSPVGILSRLSDAGASAAAFEEN